MGLLGFLRPSPPPAPKGNPETWTSDDVKHWIKSQQQLTKLWADQKPLLKSLNGKVLLNLDLDATLQSHEQLQALIAAVEQLRCTWKPAVAAVAPPAAAIVVPAAASAAASPAAAPTEAFESGIGSPLSAAWSDIASHGELLVAAASALAVEPAHSDAASLADTEDDDQALDSARPAQAGSAAAVRGYAEVLMHFTSETSPDAVTAYLTRAGVKMGAGLAELATFSLTIGRVFGSVHELTQVAQRAIVNNDNCDKLEQLAYEVLRLLDGAGKRKQGPDAAAALILGDKVAEAVVLLEQFSQPGWLLHMACDEKLKNKFDALHDSIIDTLQVAGLLDGGRALARSDYRDMSKALRRLLRQQGSGNFTTGLHALMEGQDPGAASVLELATLLEVTPQVLMREAATLPLQPAERDADEAYKVLCSQSAAVTSAMHRGVFDWYDSERSRCVDAKALTQLLSDLGMLDNLKPVDAEHLVADTLKAADLDRDNLLSFHEFCTCYAALPLTKTRQQLRTRLGMLAEDELRTTFTTFASFGVGSRQAAPGLDGANFAKLFKDCGMLDKRCNVTECDLIFAKVKSKGQRRITFDQFVCAVGMCAAKRGISLDMEVGEILAAGKPVAHGTRADTVRLHDDRSTYTGVHSRGGPNTVDPSRDLSAVLERGTQANVRGVVVTTPPPAHRSSGGGKRLSSGGGASVVYDVDPAARRLSQPGAPPVATPAKRRSTASSGGSGEAATLASRFAEFSTFGSGGGAASGAGGDEGRTIDGAAFNKLCRNCGLFDKSFTPVNADLLFAHFRQQMKGSNKIGFGEFMLALGLVAKEKNVPLATVHAAILQSQGPLLTPSRA